MLLKKSNPLSKTDLKTTIWFNFSLISELSLKTPSTPVLLTPPFLLTRPPLQVFPNSPSSSTTSRARNKSTVVATSATPTSPTASTRFKAHRSKPAEMIARYLDKAMQKGQGAQSTKEYERTLDKVLGLYRYSEEVLGREWHMPSTCTSLRFQTGFYDSSPYLQADNLPPNDTIAGPVEGLAAAHTAYDVPRYVSLLNIVYCSHYHVPKSCSLSNLEKRNVFDQLCWNMSCWKNTPSKSSASPSTNSLPALAYPPFNAPLFTTLSSLHFPPGASPSSKFPLSTSAQPTPPPTSPPHPTTSTLKSLATQLHRHPYGLPPHRAGAPQNGFCRMELIAQNKLNDVMEVGVTRFHFSIQENNQLPLNFTHEYQAANRYSLHQPNPIPSWFRRACLENPRPLPDFTPSTWHNFVVQVDWDQRTLQVFYSTDGETLEAVTDVVQICQMRVLGVSAGAGIQVTHAQQDQDQI
ncbi:hypothetical protein D9758_018079 [Tetrapyrgos nigripes]|uniref:Glycoside hydrolase 131 catalytic N-terminal domain-containing protein n=1 Tax=Tetrapyrgos nigripes TaxID=182062 RepID=A0A8H5C419_9AGAR|nr:hypothetical protein D9758_018079 [Tetrapyrgos nigripes]